MVSLIQVIILSIIQGIAEWFPISSAGHVALVQDFFGFQNLSFIVFLHIASVLGVIIVFWKDIFALLNLKKSENRRYLLLILVGIIPTGILGYIFRNQIASLLYNTFIIGIFFILSGIFIYSTKFSRQKKSEIGFIDSIFISFFQIFSILPGFSRSGLTIGSGMFKGIDRDKAVKFSFFMAIPLILAAGLVETKDLISSNINFSLLLVSFIITLAFSIFSVKALLKIEKSDKFYLFGIYNFVLGILVIVWSFYK